MKSPRIIKEACIGSLQEAQRYVQLAQQGGIDRIETCARLDQGGLTPAVAVYDYIARHNVAQVVMIRRSAGFVLRSRAELTRLEADVRLYRSRGATEFVFGYLTPAGTIDVATCQRLIDVIRTTGPTGARWVFHMAIDAVQNYDQALQTLIDLGFSRVLTKGGPGCAQNNLKTLQTLQRAWGDQIELVVGGKVTAANYHSICQVTGIKQVHGVKIA